MTAAELQAACDELNFCGGVGMWKPQASFHLEPGTGGDICFFFLSFLVPDRSDPTTTIDVRFRHTFAIGFEKKSAEEYVLERVLFATEHEARESTRFGAKRPLDPHEAVPA
jgi:hypothetical protein